MRRSSGLCAAWTASKRVSSGTSKASRTHCPAYSGSVLFEGDKVLPEEGPSGEPLARDREQRDARLVAPVGTG